MVREKALGHWIADFYSPNAQLAIEIDGGYHGSPYRRQLDLEKEGDLWLAGIKVIRFTNAEAIGNTDTVVDKIFWEIVPRWHPIRNRKNHVLHKDARVLMYQRVAHAKDEHYPELERHLSGPVREWKPQA